jgi:hypothetical protein
LGVAARPAKPPSGFPFSPHSLEGCAEDESLAEKIPATRRKAHYWLFGSFIVATTFPGRKMAAEKFSIPGARAFFCLHLSANPCLGLSDAFGCGCRVGINAGYRR